ncbi:SRPBCC domain-containing protein [Actinokineospora inagensis]|uniref:SRPBCC domain-containing protein n=1 Tax=Actinokineospora inagensis TaxID=103730 RepID=UPI00042321C2|nr:SRPBCC domain-containing protein [Actinokineospora inagensis]
MEFGSIEREIEIEATPQVVYQVVSTPEHLREWWPDDAEFEPVPGATGTVSFGAGTSATDHVAPIAVVEADPPKRFSFRWVFDDELAGRSLLVTFDLVPAGAGTLLRMTETGFREKGWEAAVLEEQYRDHASGWDFFLPRIVPYVAKLVATR